MGGKEATDARGRAGKYMTMGLPPMLLIMETAPRGHEAVMVGFGRAAKEVMQLSGGWSTPDLGDAGGPLHATTPFSIENIAKVW